MKTAIISESYLRAFNYARENYLVRGEYHIIQNHRNLDGKCFDRVVILDIPNEIVDYLYKYANLEDTPSLGNIEQKVKEIMQEYNNCNPEKELEWIYLR